MLDPPFHLAPRAAGVLAWVALFAVALPAQVEGDEVQKITATTPTLLGGFGTHVDLDGDTLVVGEWNFSIFPAQSGNASVWVRAGAGWAWQADLEPSTAQGLDHLGAVSIAGDVAAVGSRGHTGPGGESGAVFIYARTGTAWSEVDQLFAGDAALGGGLGFGTTTRLEGDTLVVSAGPDSGAATPSGSVYVFERSSGSWTQVAKLESGSPSGHDSFGAFSIDLQGDTIVAGAPGLASTTTPTVAGEVTVFRRVGGVWAQQAVLVPAAAAAGDNVGWSVDLAGERLCIGAPEMASAGRGSAYVYTRSGNVWTLEARLVAGDGVPGDAFGARVGTNGNEAIVTATAQGGFAGFGGAAYVFERGGELWTETDKFAPGSIAFGDAFGHGLTLAGTTAVIGAASEGASDSGAAYVFQLQGTTLGERLCFGDGAATPCPCSNASATGTGEGCRNSTGVGARLEATGSVSLSTGELTFHGLGLQAGAAAVLFAGASSVAPGTPLRDGLLCAVGPFQRFGTHAADVRGRVRWSVDLSSLPALAVGTRRTFQATYFDGPASPCGTSRNYTTAIEITLEP